MSLPPFVRLCRRARWLICVLLLGCAVSVNADPKPLSKEEQAKVDKAIDKAVAYLKRIQRDKGEWPARLPYGRLAQTLLPAYALLEAGVPATDPVIQKAVEYLRPELTRYVRSDNAPHAASADRRWANFDHYDTYQFSLAVLFLDRLGDPTDKKLIQSLALRLIAGQHYTGGWSYRCPQLKKEDEESFLRPLEELSKRLESGEKPTAKVLKELDIPRRLRPLTVFQDRRKFNWRELSGVADKPEGTRLDIGSTDNSNTQFAMLALWVAQHHGVPAYPTFHLMVERFERTQLPNGWWPYAGHRSPTRSMICVGLLGLAIGRGLKLAPTKTLAQGTEDLRVLQALAALYKEVGIPTGQMEKPVPYTVDMYYLWSVERVGMLYDLPTLGDKEWYRWGAEVLVTNQKPDGHWDGGQFDAKMDLYGDRGPILNTAFALLFLKHSHPMKDLTPKLPLKAGALNKGIMALRSGPASRDTSTPTSADTKDRSNKPPR